MIKLESVSKKFGSKEILSNIDLTINSNEITFIVGSSGAGKSTLLNLIGGLDNVTTGKIFYDGQDVSKNLTNYRANDVGFIFQDFNLISGLSVENNVELGLLYSSKCVSKTVIEEQLKFLGINNIKQSVETLSGGEKQRTAIIRSICKDSNVIIADEPTGNLDSKNAENVFELLVEIKKDRHIVIVSHDLDMAKRYADRIITISDGRIISDIKYNQGHKEKFQRDSIETKSNNKSRNVNWKSIFMLGSNSFKKNCSKILSIAVVISLAISSLALVFDFNSYGNSVSKEVNVNYLETDLVNVFYSFDGNLGYKEMPFNKDKINYITATYKPDNLVPKYMELDTCFFNVGSLTKQAVIKQINIDDFFRTRIMSYEIEGDFIKDENEIILAEDVAKELFEGSCIGEEISINSGEGANITLKIVGINKTVNSFDQIYSFVSSVKIKELLEKELNEKLENRLEISEFVENKPTESISVSSDGIYARMVELNSTEVCLYGSLPKKSNDILISYSLLPYALSGLNIKTPYSDEDIANNALSDKVVNELFSKKLALNHNGLFPLYISGIYVSENIEMKFHPSLISDLKQIEPTILDLYLPLSANVTEIKNSINENEEFMCTLQLENLKNNINKQTSFFKWAIILIGFIMILVSAAMLGSFSKITVLERKKEVAIIKSLGATNGEVLFTLWFDTFIISIFALIISFVLTGVVTFLLPNVIADLSFIDFRYPILPLLILGVVFTIFNCIYTFLRLNKIVKKMPADLLKN